jgi:hypothetical protein
MRLPTLGPGPVTRSQQIRYACVGVLVIEALVILVSHPSGSGFPLAVPLSLLFLAGLFSVTAYLEPARSKRFRLGDTLVIGLITGFFVLGLVAH